MNTADVLLGVLAVAGFWGYVLAMWKWPCLALASLVLFVAAMLIVTSASIFMAVAGR